MFHAKSNIVLIGMAGSGKSTVGRMLAGMLGLAFVDTDDRIVQNEGRTLQDILDTEGPWRFRQLEEKVLLEVRVRGHVIATGGSSVYSEMGMRHLGSDGVIILLHADPFLLQERIGDTSGRGLVKSPHQNFMELSAERAPLYRRYADLIVECDGLGPREVCAAILNHLDKIEVGGFRCPGAAGM